MPNLKKITVRGVPLWMDLDDQILARHYDSHGAYEEMEFELFKKAIRPGMNFIDIGAYVGDHTVFMSNFAGPEAKGYAIEAAPGNYELLVKNLEENNIKNVKAIHAAAMNYNGETEIFLSSRNHGDHRVYDAHDEAMFYEQRRTSVKIPCMTIDSLNFIPSIVKIDVQGAEMKVFAGMTKILSTNIILFCEYWPYGLSRFGQPPTDMLHLLTNYGFSIFEISEEKRDIIPVNINELTNRLQGTEHCNLCCFKEKKE